MKVSYNWLSEFLEKMPSVQETVDILTNTGLEVSGVEEFVSIQGGLEGLVIGEVIEKWQHPNADRLSLTKVNVGSGDLLQIVCGAPNVDKGQKVVVATVGTTLYPSEGDSFKIKKGKIRGEESLGMICAEDEIGLGESHEGIMVLDGSAKIGTPASEYFQIERDSIIEIDLTPNRSDAISHLGVARDLQAFLNNQDDKLEKSRISIPKVESMKSTNQHQNISVEVENNQECLRYAGLVVDGIKVGPSPEWLKNRLTSLGLASINNVVDVTNLVMMETGQPLHAFDVSQIKGHKIVVRNAKEGTKFVTLDEKERSLSSADMMICNEKEEMCIAGVFGGLSSGVSDTTTAVFIESAIFDPVKVRKTARRHGLNTDASYRFERGVDPEQVIYALNRAVDLLVNECEGQINSELVDVYPKEIKAHDVEFSVSKAVDLMGDHIQIEKIKNILDSLDIEVVEEIGDKWTLKVPAYRHDVTRQADIVEEILRIYGYNRIAHPDQFLISFSEPEKSSSEDVRNKISDMLSAMNFQEIMNNSLTSSKYYRTKEGLANETVSVLNPLSNELDVLRANMVYNGLEVLELNNNQRIKDLKLYEFGKTYSKNKNGFHEESSLSLWMIGQTKKANWKQRPEALDFFDLKQMVEKILSVAGRVIDKVKVTEMKNRENWNFGLTYNLDSKEIANLGVLNKSLTDQFDLENEVYYANIHWNVLLEYVQHSYQKKYQEFIKFPGMRRDLSLLVSNDVSFANIQDSISGVPNKWLRNVDLFDVYEGDKLPSGKKSYAISLSFQDAEKTLTDKAIDKLMDKIVERVKQELQAELR